MILQSDIEKELYELQGLCKLREARLLESRKLYRFLREAEEVAEWINDQTVVAASEDYGRDVEHVELLIQVGLKFCGIFFIGKILYINDCANSVRYRHSITS